MPYKTSFYRRIVVLVFVLLIPVLIIYTYSHHNNVRVIESELEDANMRQLNFFLSQVEGHMSQLAQQSVVLSNDNSIRSIFLDQGRSFAEKLMTRKQIEEKLSLFSASSPWENDIAIFSPITDEAMYTYPLIEYPIPEIQPEQITRWTYEPSSAAGRGGRFVWYTTDPPTARRQIESALMVVEISFSENNIVNMLDQFMTTRKGNPFFYSPGHDPILARAGNRDNVLELMDILQQMELGNTPRHEYVKLSGKDYLVGFVPAAGLDWYLVDFVPIETALEPIINNRNFFYIVIALLLVTGIGVSSAIYRTVLLPIRELIHYVQKIKRGEYSARLATRPNNEFRFLYNRFNEMAEQIQQLIEKVYEEKIRSHEATVKQLQSQINPHFLYNCLFFIASMSRLGENKAVEAMATNLGEYYRHATRVEDSTTSVGKELEMIGHYLEIVKLRHQLDYDIQIPDTMRQMSIPRLFLQPLVENAVIHGIEPSDRYGQIIIRGEIDESGTRFVVEDNGVGLEEASMRELQLKINRPLQEETGCGLWNVQQRLLYIYGEDAGVHLSRSELGGLKVTLSWRNEEDV